MRRLLSVLAIIGLVLPLIAHPPRVAASNADDAADATYYYSVLESQGDHAELWTHIHPDSAAETPRDVVVGWFEDEWYPRGPQPSTILKVEFITWTWPVNGKTYPNTALVSYRQVLRDGGANTVDTDVVHLVKSGGEWKWFFGGTREFVIDQIDKYAQSTTLADDSANIDTSNQPDFRSRDEACQWWSGLTSLMPEPLFSVFSGCLKSGDGSWFWPKSGNDSRIIGGPILTSRQRKETLPMRRLIESSVDQLEETLKVMPAADGRSRSLYHQLTDIDLNCSAQNYFLSARTHDQYQMQIEFLGLIPDTVVLWNFVQWWIGLRTAAGELVLDYWRTTGLVAHYYQPLTLGILGPGRLPMPFELESDYYTDLFILYWVYS